MGRQAILLLLLGVLLTVDGSAIPIWEMLTHEEKMGRLLYSLVHLVGEYCKKSTIPGKLYSRELMGDLPSNPVTDCRRVLMLYGVTNLMNQSEKSIDLLDPYQRNSQQLLWQAAFKTTFKFPAHVAAEAGLTTTDFDDDAQDGGPKMVIAKQPSSSRL